MKRKRLEAPDGELSCCDRRALLHGLGAAGLLMLGRCTTSGGQRPDRGLVAADKGVATMEGVAPADQSPLVDTNFVGADGGLPPIDLAAPAVTETATFALG